MVITLLLNVAQMGNFNRKNRQNVFYSVFNHMENINIDTDEPKFIKVILITVQANTQIFHN